MTIDRKTLSKRTRFEIFKRDEFTCAYCGQKPPQVTLEVDHIVPLVEGGSDDRENLTTACTDCNRGKAGIPLTLMPENVVLRRQVMAEREEQERAYIRFVRAKRKRENALLLELAIAMWGEGYEFAPRTATSARQFLARLPYDQVLLAAEKAAAKFPANDRRVFKYFCGICWRMIGGDDRGGRYRGSTQ